MNDFLNVYLSDGNINMDFYVTWEGFIVGAFLVSYIVFTIYVMNKDNYYAVNEIHD